MRVLFITNIPSPYQIDFFTSLAQQPGIEIQVLFCAAKEHDRQFSVPDQFAFPATILPSFRLPRTPKDWHCVRGMSRYLEAAQSFDVAVLSGSYFMPAIHAAKRYLQRHGIPWYYWGENPRKKGTHSWKDRIRERFLRRFLSGTLGVFGVGKRACESYRDLLSAKQTVENLPYSPNLDPILQPTSEVLEIAAGFRESWHLDSPFVIHFSGSLTPRKAPDTLIEAFIRVARQHSDCCLQIAGDGPMRRELEERVTSAALGDRVHFLGFLHGASLQATYLSSDLFVLPTRTHEGWGVVVQEALAAGLPIIATDRVGAIDDFATAGEGIIRVIPVDAPSELAGAMEYFYQQRGNLGTRPDVAKSMASRTSAEASAKRLADYLRH